jgi:signal transduction histidine kinase
VYYEPNIQFGIANVYSKQGQFDKAIALYKVSIQLANQYKREFFLKNQIYRGLSETYQKKGDYKQALDNHIIYSQYIDSVVDKQKSDQIAQLEKQYETEKKEKEILQLQAKQELTDIQLRKNKQLKLLGFVVALLLLLFVFFISKKYFDKIKLNQLLEVKNQQIAKSEQELRLLNAAKNKFFSIIAHDLKNPLHNVMGYSYLLSNDYHRFSEKERRKFAVDIYQSTNNILRLLENLLEWSKSQTGRLTFTPVETEFNRILENSASVLRPMAEQKNIELSFTCNDELKVYADPQMIETVLRNLINNAIKFTQKNGYIEIGAVQIEDKVRIHVSDTGVGISEEDAQNLFHIDSKVKRRGTNNEDGSGLGLILCKEFVAKNNGSLWVESTSGKGSLFCFTIPANASSN